jgi:hypothetical protein
VCLPFVCLYVCSYVCLCVCFWSEPLLSITQPLFSIALARGFWGNVTHALLMRGVVCEVKRRILCGAKRLVFCYGGACFVE